ATSALSLILIAAPAFGPSVMRPIFPPSSDSAVRWMARGESVTISRRRATMQPTEENVTAWQADVFKRFDKDWQESFCHVRDLIARACEAKELQSVYVNSTETVAMGTREWLGDVNTYFEQGHIFLPNGRGFRPRPAASRASLISISASSHR